MKKLTLKAEKRALFGRQVKKLRQKDILPANLYGKKVKSQALKINLKDFLAVYKEAGETGIVQLSVAKKKEAYPVLIHNLQADPVSDQPLHVDFHKIDLKAKVQVAIPIELAGEAPGVTKGGVLIQLMSEIEVESLAIDLPDKFEVDVSKLKEIGQSVSVKDLKIDKTKVKLLADKNQLVVRVEEPRKEEEEEKPAEEEVPSEEAKPEEEVTKEEKPAEKEGKKPAAAQEKPAKEKETAKPEKKKKEKK